MNQLYKLERTDEVEPDEYRGMVVCAHSADDALFKVARSGRGIDTLPFEEQIDDILWAGLPTEVEEYLRYEMLGWDETQQARDRKHWKATLIGTAAPDIEPGIIVSDYLHG